MARGPTWDQESDEIARRVCTPNEEDLHHWESLVNGDFWTAFVRRQGEAWSYCGSTREEAVANLERGLRESIERGRIATEALYKLRMGRESGDQDPQCGTVGEDQGASEPYREETDEPRG
jgi:hypothetical protein